MPPAIPASAAPPASAGPFAFSAIAPIRESGRPFRAADREADELLACVDFERFPAFVDFERLFVRREAGAFRLPDALDERDVLDERDLRVFVWAIGSLLALVSAPRFEA